MKNKATGGRKVIPILPQDGEDAMDFIYAAQQKIYPRSVSGLFANWRWGMVS